MRKWESEKVRKDELSQGSRLPCSVAQSLSHSVTHILAVLCIVGSAFSQESPYNHPELKWQTIDTDHFAVHFHQGTERTAREVASIAESVYPGITGMYDYRPEGKVHFIIRDHDDYSNGASYYYDQKIEVWATPLDFELRGQHHWLYDVVTHEFTHMVQLGASRKGPRWLPGVYFQAINYEPERRPDVLYGYPNRIVSWPVAGTIIPMWFAEGTAQYQAAGVHHDWWDTHRDMMLRVKALDGTLLTPTEMNVFGKQSIGSEYVYNQGLSLVRYIASKWGDEALKNLSDRMNRPTVWDFGRAIRGALGVSEQELYDLWRHDLTEDYRRRTDIIQANEQAGRVIRDEGFGNLYPEFSPDGKQIVFISNKGKDYLSLARPVIYEIATDSIIKTECPGEGRVVWSPDGKYLLYARQKGANKNGSSFNDLFLWDIAKKKEIRLTYDARLTYPAFFPNGKQIVAVHNNDGSLNLALVALPDSIRDDDISKECPIGYLTNFDDGRQIYSPAVSPDGSYIICASSLYDQRDLYWYNFADSSFTSYLATDNDERDPAFSPDGKALYWSDDRTGIFNIYRRELATGRDEAVTNVIGGAFTPSIRSDGALAYSRFTSKGYGVSLMDKTPSIDPLMLRYKSPDEMEHLHLEAPEKLEIAAHPYSSPFHQLSVLPRIAWDYGKFKPGIYAYTGDILDRLTLFGGAAANPDGERDLYATIEYRMLYPTLFAEAYNIVRKKRESFDDPFKIIGERYVDSLAVPIYGTYGVDYRFNLAEYDIGARVPAGKDITASLFLRASAYNAALWLDDGSSFDYTYFRGSALILRLDGDLRELSVGRDIQPRGGWQGWVELARESNRFLDSFRVDMSNGLLKEVYRPYDYFRFETDVSYFYSLGGNWTVSPRIILGRISKDNVDPFFYLYAGGLPGLRGYSYYSIGGKTKAVVRVGIQHPVSRHIDWKWGPLYLDQLHAGLFTEVGNARESNSPPQDAKTDAGFELRLKMYSWYGFPTDVQFAGAYGFDRFSARNDPSGTVYGREWRWYVTVLFDFL